MSRARRLFDLLQLLRRHRRPVGGAALASALGISLRTLYRDVATLQAQGAAIDGAPGLGYVLRPGFELPPLMFGGDEVEALALGTRWVARHGDPRLAAAARDALAKIAAVLPPPLAHAIDASALLVGGRGDALPEAVDVGLVRAAIRQEQTLAIDYRDGSGSASTRTIWPIALGYFDQSRVVVAWCELRQALRHFRTDRIDAIAAQDARYPRRRQALLAEWRAQQGIAADEN